MPGLLHYILAVDHNLKMGLHAQSKAAHTFRVAI